MLAVGTAFLTPALAQDQRQLVESKESLYNNIYVYKEGDYYAMTFGYNRRIYTESEYNSKDDRELPVAYTRYMTATLMYAKHVHSILEIGFGGGRTSWYLHRFLPGVSITSVELDPEVEALAKKYFGIKDEPNFHLVNQDGRLFLTHSKDKYDIVLIDAYRGPFVPFHLLTKEFYQVVKDHLAPGGVVAQNVEPSTMLFDSSVKTIQSV
ncbi:MAG TPA: fused MFS/spermidine synthase, partial [Stellaceae bacterium]|nr:fused MFS/spermidine synthase [Stellaceae bacterium]